MNLITIKTFNHSFEARVIKSRLESEGIESYLFDENTVSVNPFYTIPIGGIKLKITEEDLNKAKEILSETTNVP